MVKRIITISIVSLTLQAQNILEEIKSDISRYNDITQISKENEFFQPHILSVYKGYELEKIGVQNLQEALELVPGVDIYANNLDFRYPVFRGSNPMTYGQTKLFIDGVLVNNLFGDHYTQYMSMPIELIKRIEVIRGPGSKTEGINAYAGAIYVTTYAENFGEFSCNKLFAKRGSELYRAGGFYTNHHIEAMKIYLEGYYQQDDKRVPAGPDMAYTGYLGDINKPLAKTGNAPIWMKNYSFATTLSLGDFKLQARTNYFKHGMGFGLSYLLPSKKDYMQLPNRYMELSYRKNLNKNLKFTFKSGLRLDALDIDTQYAPAGLVVHDPFNPTHIAVYKDGAYGVFGAKQRTVYGKGYFTYTKWRNHKITFGTMQMKEQTYEVKTITTDKTGSTAKLIDYSHTFPFLYPDAKRTSNIYFISDTFKYSDDLDIYYGINIEKNTQTDYIVNPRLSIVYQLDKANLIKLSYSKSHRNPSWQELFTINNTTKVGNPNLRPERVHALEGSYIRRFSSDDYLDISLFFLKNKNLINNVNLQHRFENRDDQNLYGAEIEYSKMVDRFTKLYANYSYVTGKNADGSPLANIAKHLAKATIYRRFTPNLSASFVTRYVGKKERYSIDPRKKLDDYIQCDMALNFLFNKSAKAQLSVKNIFDADIRYPSPPFTYINDYPAMKGRTFIFSIVWGL